VRRHDGRSSTGRRPNYEREEAGEADSRNRLTIDSLLSSARPDVFPRSSRRPSMTSSVVLMKSTKDERQTCA